MPLLAHIYQMVKIYNSDVTKGLAKSAGIATAKEKVPDELAEKIVPVFETNPDLLRKCDVWTSVTAANSLTTTIYTVPEDRDFYLVSASLSLIKDANATSTKTEIRVPLNKSGVPILTIPSITLTAQDAQISVCFPFPIKVQRGSAIYFANSTNVGNINVSAGIAGYFDEKSLS